MVVAGQKKQLGCDASHTPRDGVGGEIISSHLSVRACDEMLLDWTEDYTGLTF